MNKYIDLNWDERNLIISNVADKKKMSKAIVEKDFWVCWTLKYLFNEFKYNNFICFKGGTCLSKVYNAIERFSEDIDIALDWECLAIEKEVAYLERSNRQQGIFNNDANKKTADYIKEVWIPQIQSDFDKRLKDDFLVYIDELDAHTICFEYPQMNNDISILQIIRIEVGVLAESFPSTKECIETYISEVYPEIFTDRKIEISAVSINRTFFEKLTILHREANRTNGNYPERYSRHFYDVYRLIKIGVGKRSFNFFELLEKTIDFKIKFYPCRWAKYNEVMKGHCRLVPNEAAIKIFKHDYQVMQGMIYGESLEFDLIIEELRKYEEILNKEIIKYNMDSSK